MMTIQLENGLSITLRASGTEPKLKFYSQMGPTSVSKDPVQFGIQKDQAQKILVTLVEELIAKWIVPETLGITLA